MIDYLYRGGGITLALFATLMTIVLAIPLSARRTLGVGRSLAAPRLGGRGVPARTSLHGTAPGQPLSAVAWSGVGFAILTAALLLVDRGALRWTQRVRRTLAAELPVSAS